MPKPSRAERRRLAEKGKLTPRRRDSAPVADRPALSSSEPAPVARSTSRTVRAPAAAAAADELDPLPDAQEYAYVKSDLLRILVLAVLLIGVMVALHFVLPQ